MRQLITAVVLALAAGAAGAQETTRILPAAASAAGVGDSFFVTDVRLFNPSPTETITVRAAFLRRDRDNTGAGEVSVELPPRSAVRYGDVLADLLGVDGAGGVVFRSDRPFLATSRTFNAGGDAGTFGQYIPGQTPDDALGRGILLSVTNDPTSGGFRANVGFANPTAAAVEVTVRVFDAAQGALLGETSRTLPPLAVTQVNDVFRAVGSGDVVIRNATVEFSATAPVLGYASVLDNTSDDPIYVLPFADAGTPDDENSPPDGAIDMPEDDVTATVGATVDFDGSGTDPDGDDLTAEWDFGDGSTAPGLTAQHAYQAPGTYTVVFTVTDDRGLSDPDPPTRTVTVDEAATFTEVQDRIFMPSCALSGCHGNGSASAGMNLDPGNAYGNIVDVPSSERPELDRVEPGDPDASYMYLKVTGDPSISGGRMPLGRDPLSQELVDLLRGWIEVGAPDN